LTSTLRFQISCCYREAHSQNEKAQKSINFFRLKIFYSHYKQYVLSVCPEAKLPTTRVQGVWGEVPAAKILELFIPILWMKSCEFGKVQGKLMHIALETLIDERWHMGYSWI